MDNVLRPYVTRLPGTVLTQTQQLVSSNLAPIFSFYTKTQLDAVVLFESSNYIQPVDSQGLLQRCIDFILDNPDQLEAVVNQTAAFCAYKSANVIDVLSDDDDIELLGAVNSYENNLTNPNTTTKISDERNFTGPYTDELPNISSPQRKRPASSGKVEITIADSPNISQNCISVSSTEDLSNPGLSSVRNNNNQQDEYLNSDPELPRNADDEFVDDEDSLPDLDSLFAKIDKTKACDSDTNVPEGSKSTSLRKSLFGNTSSKTYVPDGAFVMKSPNKSDVILTAEPSIKTPTIGSDQGAKTEVKTKVSSPSTLNADGVISSNNISSAGCDNVFASNSFGGKSSDTQNGAKIGSGPVWKFDSLSSTSGAAKSPLRLFRHDLEERFKQMNDASTLVKTTPAGRPERETSVAGSVLATAANNSVARHSVEVKGMVYYSAVRQNSQGFLPGRLTLEDLGAQWKGSVLLEGKQEPDLMFMLEQRSIKSLIEWNEGLVLELKSGSKVKLIIDPTQAFNLKIVNNILNKIKKGRYAVAQHQCPGTTSSTGQATSDVNRNMTSPVDPHTLAPTQIPKPPDLLQQQVIQPRAAILQTHQYEPAVNNAPPPKPTVINIPLPPKPPAVNIPPLPKPRVVSNPPTPFVNNPNHPPPPPPPVVNMTYPPHPKPQAVNMLPHLKPPVVNNPPNPLVNNLYLPPPPPAPLVNIPNPPPPPPPPTPVVDIPPPPKPPAVKTTAQQLEEWKLEVLQLFPRVELRFLEGRLQAHYGPYAVNNVCSELLEMADYPKSHSEPAETEGKPQAKEETVDYYKDYDKVPLSIQDRNCSLALLKEEFRRVSARDISDVWSAYEGHYAPSYQVLEEAMRNAYAKKDQPSAGKSTSRTPDPVKNINIRMKYSNKEKVIATHLLKCGRQKRSLPYMSLLVNKEVVFVNKRKAEQKEKDDFEMAWKLNEEQYEEDGQTIECGCCFCEYPFESMVQCTEGHLFCTQCLLSYAKEAVFGSGKLNLSCMTDGCEATYPQSEMKRAVPSEILCQYEDRVREENLNLADLSNLVRCPYCNYAAIMDVEGDKVFRCQNKECMKETCRLCKEDWGDHIGLPCHKVEKKDETKLRKEYEEKMTEAKVRTCHRCKSKFMKEEGCNRMTCTCRATMCYICRAKDIDYNHFCRHPRDPGQLCKECKSCSLWTNPDEDDKRAIEEIRKEAQEKRKEQGFDDDKAIGAPSEPAAKKPRRK